MRKVPGVSDTQTDSMGDFMRARARPLLAAATVVGLAQGLQLCPVLHYGTRPVATFARAAALRASGATDERTGEAGADGSSPIAWKDAALPTNDDDAGKLLRIRHSTAHVMAMAVQKLFKGTKAHNHTPLLHSTSLA